MHLNFDLSNGYVILRIMCGVCLIPHALGKLSQGETAPQFYDSIGLRPGKFWFPVTRIMEFVLCPMMILGLFTQYAAALTCIFLIVAGAVCIRVSKHWVWQLGGCEYPFFWAACCAIVAYYGAAAGA